MKNESARYIYGIILLGSGFGLMSTLISYLTYPKTISSASSSKTPVPKNYSMASTDISAMLSRNIFNIEGTIPNDGQLTGYASQCVGEPVRSPLSYDIVGILYGGNSKSSMAVLQNRNTQEISIVKQGSKLPQKGYISDIDADRVWIVLSTCPEYIQLPKFKLPPSRVRKGGGEQTASDQSYSEPGFERIGTDTNVTRQWVNDILTNKLASVLGDALAIPHMTNGRIDGFTISQIEPMSVFDKMGLKNGDVVMSLNGIPLNDAGQAIQTLNALRNEGDVTMQVMRNGQIVSFRVNVQQ